MRKQLLLALILLHSFISSAQRVYPLVAGITVDSVMTVKPYASKLARNPLTGRLFYTTSIGEIYEVYIPGSGPATDSLRYTATDHGISYIQGLYFRDSVMYVCGNNWSATTAVGKVVKGKLQPNGTRVWTDIATTNPYPSSSPNGDHGFSGVNLDPAGEFIYVSSGARTHLGEVRTNGGAWPGKREVPLTTRIFKFPVNSTGIILPNDSTLIDNSGYVFAWGTRNAYDMAWDANNNLFAIDNSGERDDPEELNWLREGRHYGFPWNMGGNDNPLRVSPYDVDSDPLVNHACSGYVNGWFADDPTFPAVPGGVTFTEPVRNYGAVADFYRDPLTGDVKNASDEGTYISSFTAHRSPLGLFIDRDSMLAAPFRGDAFVMSFMPGGDSSGYTPISPWGGPCPFVDSSRELVQMKLTYNAGIDNYSMTTSNVLRGFYLPVDAELVGNVLYVIENGGDLWRITFPAFANVTPIPGDEPLLIYPNPFNHSTTIRFDNPNSENYTLTICNTYGQICRVADHITSGEVVLEKGELASGIYYFQLKSADGTIIKGKLVAE